MKTDEKLSSYEINIFFLYEYISRAHAEYSVLYIVYFDVRPRRSTETTGLRYSCEDATCDSVLSHNFAINLLSLNRR